ncbi:Agamous-like MADS-box protein AGL80 [Linum perenne]
MTRKKVQLVYIGNESARKTTFKKRKKGLLKKVRELSTLCDIQACAIVYSPYDAQPETWPPTMGGVHHVLSRFKKMPQMEQCKKMISQEKFLADRINKSLDQLRKYDRDNREKEVNQAVFHCLTGQMGLQGLTMADLELVSSGIDKQIKEIDHRLVELSRGGGTAVKEAVHGGVGSSLIAPTVDVDANQVAPQIAEGDGAGGGVQWFTELMVDPAAAEQQMGYNGDELMMMMMTMQQGAGTGGGTYGESSNCQAVTNNNNNPPFFG